MTMATPRTMILARCLAILALLQFSSAAHAGLFGNSRAEIKQFEKDFTAAVGRNDVAGLQRFLADDWTIVSGDGSIITRETFLQVMATGDLVHQSMDPQNQSIRQYGDSAVVTGHVQSGGSYKGATFHTDEISTDILVKAHGHWVCVLTQLTAVAARAIAPAG